MDAYTIAHFASPLKKHKPMPSLGGQHECLFTTPTKGNKAAAAHNLRFSSGPAASPGPRTPGVGLKGLGSAPAASPCPCTPGAGPKTRGSSGCNAYMQPPSPRSSAAAPLPPKLAILKDLLGALYAAMPLMRTRGQLTTFQNLQQPVQQLCGRNFTVEHLQQIKHLHPDAFSWQALKLAAAAAPTQRNKPPPMAPLLLSMVELEGGRAAGGHQAQQQSKQQLEQRLAEFAATNVDKMGCVADVPLAELPSGCWPSAPSTQPAAAATPSKESSTVCLLPATPQGAQAPGSSLMIPCIGTPVLGGAKTAPARCRDLMFSPVASRTARQGPAGGTSSKLSSRTSNNLFGSPAPVTAAAPHPATTTPASEAAPTPRMAAAGGKVRRLTFKDASPSRGAPAAAAAAAAAPVNAKAPQQQAAGVAQTPATSVSGSGSSGLFQLPSAALALLQSKQAIEVLEQRDARRADLEANHVLSLVPRSFDIVRGIFGERGLCVKPRDEVVSQLRAKCAYTCGLSAEQAAQQLTFLLRMLPEWIKLENVQGQHLLQLKAGKQLRIKRNLPSSQLRSKLRSEVDAAIAAVREAREGGEAEAAGAGAAAAEAPPVTPRKPLLTDGLALPGASRAGDAAVAAAAQLQGVSHDAVALLQ